MAAPKEVLVVTTSSIEGLKIKKYLKPVSAHIVTGTNLFSDFLGGLTDILGGRSHTYQKQLSSIYNEAIERIKFAAYELGANCVLGLTIDMDEISGKGKSMFMLTAIGTAVVLEKESIESKPMIQEGEKFENVAVDRIHSLRKKKAIIKKAEAGQLTLNEEIWEFITTYQVDEIFSALLNKFVDAINEEQSVSGTTASFYKNFISYVDALPEIKKLGLLYTGIKNAKSEKLAAKLSDIIRELTLFDYALSMELLINEDFIIQKRGLKVVTYDKPFFNAKDKEDLESIREYVKAGFPERGKRTTKKQLLSKEKDVWLCECGKTNDIDTYCFGCSKDIYGFKENEYKPAEVDNFIQQKIELISEYLQD